MNHNYHNLIIEVKDVYIANILGTNHDSLPTQRFCLANLSLVLRSNKHEIAMANITSKNKPTQSPESAYVVILSKIFESTLGLHVCCNLLDEEDTTSAVKIILDYWAWMRVVMLSSKG